MFVFMSVVVTVCGSVGMLSMKKIMYVGKKIMYVDKKICIKSCGNSDRVQDHVPKKQQHMND